MSQQLAIENQKRRNDGLPILNSVEYVAREWFISIAHTVRDHTRQKKT
jgi:hypothetical protein